MENKVSGAIGTPTQAIIRQIVDLPVFTARILSGHSDVTEQRFSKLVATEVLNVGNNPTKAGPRRLYSLADSLTLGVFARLAYFPGSGLETRMAGALASMGAWDIIREWMQAAYEADMKQTPDSATIRRNVTERGYTFYVKPDPFGILDDAEARIQTASNVLLIPTGANNYNANGCDPDAPFRQAMDTVAEMTSAFAVPMMPFVSIDLGPWCRGLLKHHAKCVYPNVIINHGMIPPEVLQEWEQKKVANG